MASERTDAWGGIDLGGTKIAAAIVDARGQVLGRARQPTPRTGGPAAIVAQLAATLAEAARSVNLEPSDLQAIGVGAPGATDPTTGILSRAPNLDDWLAPYPLAGELEALTGTGVRLGNDVQVAVGGEAILGAGRGAQALLGVWWGTGVGGGIVLEGRRWIGRGAAGEIGHTIVKVGGARCGCGRRGCLEAYAGRASMERRARKLMQRGEKTRLFELMEERGRLSLTSGVWHRALAEEDTVAERIVERALHYLAAGIASAVNLLDVEAVVLGGGLGTRLGPLFLDSLQEQMLAHLFVPDRPPALRLSLLGELAGAVGAALLAMPEELREGLQRTAGAHAVEASHAAAL